jgi:hypothetical protein
MNDIRALDARYETVTWGVILILVGVLDAIPGNQAIAGVLGIGIVLLGLNLARHLSRIPVSPFSITLGAIALGLGAVAILRPLLGWEFHLDLPAFATVLIVIGLYLLLPGRKRLESERIE